MMPPEPVPYAEDVEAVEQQPQARQAVHNGFEEVRDDGSYADKANDDTDNQDHN